MSDNPPLFDDDDLPSWLQEAGITPNKPDNQSTPLDANTLPMADLGLTAQPADDAQDEFDWFAATFGEGSPAAQASTPEPSFDPMANPAEDEWWMKGEAQFADQQAQAPAMPGGWQHDEPIAKKKGSTTPLPWFAENVVEPSTSHPAESPVTEQMPDLFASIAPPSSPSLPNIPTATPKPGTGPLNKPKTGPLSPPPAPPPGTGQLTHDAPTIADAGRRTVRKITGPLAPVPTPTPPSSPVPVVPSSEKQPPMPPVDNNPIPPDSNEIEDWFASLNLPNADEPASPAGLPPTPAASTEPEDFMPDWMLKGELPKSDVMHTDSLSDADSEALANFFSEPPAAAAAGGVAADDAPAWLTDMTPADAAPRVGLPADAAPQQGVEMDWLDNLESNVSDVNLQSGEMRPMELGWFSDSPTPTPTTSAPNTPSSLNEGELNIDDLLSGGSPDIDSLLNLSANVQPPSASPSRGMEAMDSAPTFDSAPMLTPAPPLSAPAARFGDTSMRSPEQARAASKPKDDLDALFADDVITEDIFSKRDVAGTAMFQDIGLQGDTSGTADSMPAALTASGMTAMFNRGDNLKGAATPDTPKPAATEEPFRDFGNVGEVLPEWVSDMRPTDLPIALNVGDQVVKLKEEPLSKLPEQVRALRDRAKEFRVAETKQSAPLEGPLAGITGAITPIAAQSTTALPSQSSLRRPATAMTDTFTDRIKVLQSLLNLEQEVLERQKLEQEQREAIEKGEAIDAVKAGTRTRATLKLDRVVVTLLLLAVVLFPFVTNASNIMPSLDNVAASLSASDPRFQHLSQTLTGLNAGQTVLIAFEYAPTAAGEMDEIARVLLTDLVERGVRPVVISTNPAGVMHAYAMLDQLGRNAEWRTLTKRSSDLVNRQDYYVLRYLSGGIVGLRTLVNAVQTAGIDPIFETDFEGQATNLTDEMLNGLRTAPTFVLAESADDVRNWAEQYRVSSEVAPRPIVLFSSAGASAIAQSYASASDHIVSVLVGVRDAAIYSRLNGLEGDAQASQRAEQRWQSLQLGLLFTSFVILFGMVFNTMRGLLRRRATR